MREIEREGQKEREVWNIDLEDVLYISRNESTAMGTTGHHNTCKFGIQTGGPFFIFNLFKVKKHPFSQY